MNNLILPESLRQLSSLPKADLDAEWERRQYALETRLTVDEDREACKSFSTFIRRAWPVVEPFNPYVHGWHIAAIADHLSAVSRGEILRLLINVPPGMAKALDADTPIFTTWGWKRHGDLQPGDFVFGPDGQPKRILACTPDMIEESYDVGFDDGSSIVAGAGHLWQVDRDVASVKPKYTRGRKTVVVTTTDLTATHAHQNYRKRADRIGVCAPIRTAPKRLLIDPYLLGFWLGDGGSATGCLYVAEQDYPSASHLGRVANVMPAAGDRKQAFYRLVPDGLTFGLRACGLIDNKHIPPDYLEASVEQRIALLQGLMDTDGTADKQGNCTFSNLNPRLIDDAKILMQSLGLKVGTTSRYSTLNGKRYGPHHKLTFTPPFGLQVFRLARKQARIIGAQNARSQSRYVRSVTPVGQRIVKCIQVEGGLYLAGKAFVTTHNSLISSVLWPAWEWGPLRQIGMRYLTTSYSAAYVTRDARKMLELVQSDWFQGRWPVEFTRTGADSFENTQKGFREGVPFSRLTGGRGHRVIIDDPHSTEMAESEAERATTTRIFRESVPTRLVEPSTSAIIVIMQRLHVEDVSGIALSFQGAGAYTHLCLPMEFETDRACHTSLGFSDPRTKEGELLFPERFPREVVERDKAVMGSFAVAGQFQQRPTLRSGGLFKREWFAGKILDASPAGVRWVRYWDLAATEESLGSTAAYTVGVKLGRMPNGKFVVADVHRLRAEGQGVRNMIRETAKEDGPLVEIGLPQDPGQAGKVQARDMVLMLAGYVARALPESGDKATRAEPVAAQAEAGNLFLVKDDWNETFLSELTEFPGSKYKDQVDALSGAFSRLIGGTVFSTPEDQFVCQPLKNIPDSWPRVAAIDIRRSLVTTVWAAVDRVSETVYITDAVTQPRQDMAIHASTIRKKGKWIPVLFDHLANGRDEPEGIRLATQLADEAVELLTMPLELEDAIEAVSGRLNTARFCVFNTLEPWLAAYRRLSRNEKDQITGDDTGMIAATGLIVASGIDIAISERRAASNARGYDEDDPNNARN